jgi:hypothetical protein
MKTHLAPYLLREDDEENMDTRIPQEKVMHYELLVRQHDVHSERIMALLLEKRVPFVELKLSEAEAERNEALAGRKLPYVRKGKKTIGGYSDVVNDLRRPSRSRPVAMPAW